MSNIYIWFHGSCDRTGKKSSDTGRASNQSFTTLHYAALLSGNASFLYDGVGSDGSNFTTNLLIAYHDLISALTSKLMRQTNVEIGECNIYINGHSRGGVQALALYNLLQLTFEIEADSKSSQKEHKLLNKVFEATGNDKVGLACKMQQDIKLTNTLAKYYDAINHLKKILQKNIIKTPHLLMADPVKGSLANSLWHRHGYKICDNLFDSIDPLSETVAILAENLSDTLLHEKCFDAHIPTSIEPLKIMIAPGTTHTSLVRYPSEFNRHDGSIDCFAFIAKKNKLVEEIKTHLLTLPHRVNKQSVSKIICNKHPIRSKFSKLFNEQRMSGVMDQSKNQIHSVDDEIADEMAEIFGQKPKPRLIKRRGSI